MGTARHFESDDFMILKFRRRINSGTVHVHAEFGDDIFPQYCVMSFYCKKHTDRYT